MRISLGQFITLFLFTFLLFQLKPNLVQSVIRFINMFYKNYENIFIDFKNYWKNKI